MNDTLNLKKKSIKMKIYYINLNQPMLTSHDLNYKTVITQ